MSDGPKASPVTQPPVDATGLVVETILEVRDGSGRHDDAIIVAALKASGCGIRPKAEQAAELFDRLQQVAQHEGLATRELVSVCQRLLAQANRGGQKSVRQNPFASYLSILVS